MGACKEAKPVGLNQIVQCCDVTESYQPFGGFAKEGEIQCLYEVYRTVSATTAENGLYLRVIHHALEVAQTLLDGSGISTGSTAGVFAHNHLQSPGFQSLFRSFQK